MLQNDLKEALEKDAAKPTPGAYSTPTCLHWEIDYRKIIGISIVAFNAQ
jgi:hypothetical protein